MKKQTVGTQATVTTEMMEEILDWAVPNFLTTAMIGFPGVGKTSIYQQSAVRHGMRFVAAHPVVDDPSDYKGIPWVVKNGKDSGATADFVPIGYLRELIETREPLFLLLDDFPQALPAVQAAIMPLLDSRTINGISISPMVGFGIAGNRRGDKAAASAGIIEPIKSRCSGGIYHVEPSTDGWAKWAIRAKIPTWIIACVRARPNLITEWTPTDDLVNQPCPRTVARCGEAVLKGCPEPMWSTVFTGIAGQAASMELIAFYRHHKDMPNPDAIIASPLKGEIPQKPDIQYVLVAALAYRTKPDNFKSVLSYMDRWMEGGNFNDGIPRREFVLAYIKDAVTRNDKLKASSVYVDWSVKNADLYI